MMTAALFVGANFAISAFTGKQQRRIETANINLNLEQSRLQAAESAYELSKNYRKNMSENLALSGMGFGGTSGFAATSAESTANFLADSAALQRQGEFAAVQAQSGLAVSKISNFARNANAVMSSAVLAEKLGLFDSKGLKK